MAKAKKIKKEQLSRLQDLVRTMSDIKSTIGSLELEKTNLFLNYEAAQRELENAREELKKEYGDVNVNLTTGEYEVIKED